MIRGGRLRPLAVLGTEPLELAGHGTIPPVTEWVPEISLVDQLFRHLGAQGRAAPTCSRPWTRSGRTKIANSKALQDYAADRGALFTPYHGDEAHERAMGMVRQNAWLLYDAGKAPNVAHQFGIDKPGGM